MVEAPLPTPGAGQVLVRNRFFLVFPGLRTLIGGEVDGVPLPAPSSGDALFGPAVGEVVAAPDDSPLRPGDTVTHLHGWRDHAVVDAAHCTPVGDALPGPVAHLAQGSSAYGALTRLAGVRTGDTVLVTGAAGAVGTLAEQLPAAVGAARQGARFALVGALSGQLSARRAGGSAPVEIDSFRVVVKGVTLRGYAGTDHPDVEQEWTGRFGQWLRSGEIAFPHTRIAGIDRAPQALQELTEGRHLGAVVVEL